MTTRGTPESASAPPSPSSRAAAAPSDSKPPADAAVVVDDVSGGEEPWTAISARRIAADTKMAEARKCKKKAVKRPTASPAAKPATRDTELEEKAAPPPSKKVKKAAAPSASSTSEPKLLAALRGVADAPSRPDRDTPTASSCPDMTAELQALREEVRRLRGLVAAQDPTARGFVSPGATTEPNTRRELPPLELRQFTTASFPEWTKKAKGDYNPPQAHL
ncbi:hypothetical protein ON010_g4557 [Phytophthora cinnamomi]|nr:hypothetical protein ON010_g4557 [Phytophthora cinnamomi]